MLAVQSRKILRWSLRGAKNLSSSSPSITTFEEVKIPVPWGHISGKWWGDKKQIPIIAIHDLKQNCAVFDKLIPQLNANSVLAIDLPGHGQSSHFHMGRYLTHLEYIIALRYLSKKLPIGLFSFLGHGFGSTLAFLFSAAYFKLVDNLMSVECSRHIVSEFNFTQPNAIGVFADRHDELERQKTPPLYEHNEMIALIRSSHRDMSDEAAQALFTRSTREVDGKFCLTHDPRMEIMPLSFFTNEDMLMADDHVRTTTCMIRNVVDDEELGLPEDILARPACFDANMSHLIRRFGPKMVRERYTEGVERLRESARYLVTHELRAKQHILYDSSEQVAKILNGFMATNLETHQYYYKTSK